MKMMRTSDTHPLHIATIPIGEHGGRLGVTFCPGKYQDASMTGAWSRDVATDLQSTLAWGARHLVTLITDPEITALRVTDLGRMAGALGIAWYHLPIIDGDVPDAEFEHRWDSVGPLLCERLFTGDGVVVHCMGGLGRAGTIAARILLETGTATDADEAIRRVRAVRPGAVENVEQEAYLQALATRSQGMCAGAHPSVRIPGISR